MGLGSFRLENCNSNSINLVQYTGINISLKLNQLFNNEFSLYFHAHKIIAGWQLV